jgi:hypothetical protein
VIVRAEIGGKVWWLDPTVEEEAAHDPALQEAPRFGWALPVHAGAAGGDGAGAIRAGRQQAWRPPLRAGWRACIREQIWNSSVP